MPEVVILFLGALVMNPAQYSRYIYPNPSLPPTLNPKLEVVINNKATALSFEDPRGSVTLFLRGPLSYIWVAVKTMVPF